jgi:hypothetical protein
MRNSKKDVMLHAMGNCQEYFGTYFIIILLKCILMIWLPAAVVKL